MLEQILRTDNAYDAIDKINRNFANSGNGSVIAEGSLVGAGSSFVYFVTDKIKSGELVHLDFGSDWSGQISGVTANQSKLAVGYYDKDNNPHPLFLVYRDSQIQSTGYDLHIPLGAYPSYKSVYIAIRANTGVTVNLTVSRINIGDIKPWFAEEIKNTVNKVKARINVNSIVFPLVTDIHFHAKDEDESKTVLAPYLIASTVANIKAVSDYVRIDNIICLGDSINGKDTVEISNQDAEDLQYFFSYPNKPLLYAVGNHDDNRYFPQGSRRFSAQEIVSKYIQQIDERTSIDGAMDGCNWYRDIERNKIRIIGLCGITFSGTYGFTNDTQSWLSGVLSSLPEGYKAIITTHVPILSKMAWSSTQYSGGEQIANIISSNIDKVIALFYGHTHLDNVFVSPFVAINLASNKCYPFGVDSAAPEDASYPNRSAGTASEDLWDTIAVDKENSLISCIRFGAGTDRYIHFSPISVSAGGSATLSPSIITAASWRVRTSEAGYISVSNGVVTISASAPEGRYEVSAADADGNREFWVIKVS